MGVGGRANYMANYMQRDRKAHVLSGADILSRNHSRLETGRSVSARADAKYLLCLYPCLPRRWAEQMARARGSVHKSCR